MRVGGLVFCFLVCFCFGWGSGAIIFEDNFDGHEDWSPTAGRSECNYGNCSDEVPIGWSYYRSTGLWWAPNYEDTIRVTADNTRGGNGKAYTQFNEANAGASGDGWGADGMLTHYFSKGSDEVSVQFWMKVDPDWQWAGDSSRMIKVFRMGHYDGNGNVYQYFSGGNTAPLYTWFMQHSYNYGWRHNHGLRCAPQLSYYYCSDGAGDNYRYTGSPDFKDHLGDGEWHRLKFYFKMNDVGVSNGIIRFWFDGVLEEEVLDKMWIVEGEERKWNIVGIGGNANNPWTDESNFGEQWYAIDDIVVSDSDIADDYVPGGEVVLNCVDNDNDGYGIGSDCLDLDCNDSDLFVNPGVLDVCGNLIDEDCDGEDLVCDVDLDLDGFNSSIDCNDTNENLSVELSCSFDGKVCGEFLICVESCPEDLGGVCEEVCDIADKDVPCDGVQTDEVILVLEEWSFGGVLMSEVLRVVGVWKN